MKEKMVYALFVLAAVLIVVAFLMGPKLALEPAGPMVVTSLLAKPGGILFVYHDPVTETTTEFYDEGFDGTLDKVVQRFKSGFDHTETRDSSIDLIWKGWERQYRNVRAIALNGVSF